MMQNKDKIIKYRIPIKEFIKVLRIITDLPGLSVRIPKLPDKDHITVLKDNPYIVLIRLMYFFGAKYYNNGARFPVENVLNNYNNKEQFWEFFKDYKIVKKILPDE